MSQDAFPTCPACHQPVGAGATLCPNCGQPLPNALQTASPETLLLDVPANMWRGAEAVGGRLQVTDYRIVFQSHGFNVQVGTTEIPLADVQSVSPCNTLGIVPNGIRVTLQSGTEYRFVAAGRSKIIQLLLTHISGNPR